MAYEELGLSAAEQANIVADAQLAHEEAVWGASPTHETAYDSELVTAVNAAAWQLAYSQNISFSEAMHVLAQRYMH